MIPGLPRAVPMVRVDSAIVPLVGSLYSAPLQILPADGEVLRRSTIQRQASAATVPDPESLDSIQRWLNALDAPVDPALPTGLDPERGRSPAV